MGIANDIRPKRSDQAKDGTDEKKNHQPNFAEPKNTPQVDSLSTPTAPSQPKQTDQEPIKILTSNKEPDLGEHFFGNQPNQKHPGTVNQSSAPHKSKTTLIIIMWLIIFFGIVAYAAYLSYTDLFQTNSQSDSKSTSANSNDYYSGEVITQDQQTTEENEENIDNSQEATTVTPPTNSSTTATATPTPTQTATPAATPPSKSGITIKILNGNGINGSAQKVKTQLVTAGFTVGPVTNAQRFTYQTTIIYYQTGKEAEANLVKASLSDRVVETQLSDQVATSHNVVVVVGKT